MPLFLEKKICSQMLCAESRAMHYRFESLHNDKLRISQPKALNIFLNKKSMV